MARFIARDFKNGILLLTLRDRWVLVNHPLIKKEIESSPPHDGKTEIDASALQSLDTSGASQILSLAEKHRLMTPGDERPPAVRGLKEDSIRLYELVFERARDRRLPPAKELNLFQAFGRSSLQILELALSLLTFIGEVSFAVFALILRPALFRAREFAMQLKVACIDAIPIVGMVTFLIGIVVAYLMAIQIEKFGANIFIVDAVSLALARELSPILVAVVVAGRSGSAFTAQIGTMKLNEEIDAITTLGFSPFQVLVLPRIFALMIAMPLLVFVGDIAGILGSMLIAKSQLGITATTFIDRLQSVLTVKSFMVGLVKAPVFAGFIATIGCKMGMSVENNARSVGLHTTSTVVQSIVAVILLNAAFAVIFTELGI